jgi:hypothetical protein
MNPRQFAIWPNQIVLRIFSLRIILERWISYDQTPASSCTAHIRHTATNASFDVPEYTKTYPIIRGVQNGTPKIYFFSQGILGLAPGAEGPAVMLVATSGPRSPMNGFVVTHGTMFLLALNHIPPSITIMPYPLPVFARLSLAPGRWPV